MIIKNLILPIIYKYYIRYNLFILIFLVYVIVLDQSF